MFQEYCLWNIRGNIQKKFPMKFQGIFPINVPEILNIGIFPDCFMNILQMLHGFL